MLNKYLPLDILYASLNLYLESWEFIYSSIKQESDLPLRHDKDILGDLHHALNIDKYSNLAFRQQLLHYAPNTLLRSFLEKRKITYGLQDLDSVKFRHKLANFSWANNDETRDFITEFGYPDYLIPRTTPARKSEQFFPSQVNPYKPLKDYQANVFFQVQQHIEFPNIKLLIQMPTGSGKTRVAMEIVSSFLNKQHSRTVVWLADRSELCEQAYDAFVNVWSHEGKCDLNLYRLWGNSKTTEFHPTESKFVIAMYQKIRSVMNKPGFELKADLIITDEAHNVLAHTYNKILYNLKDISKHQTRIVGLSATPGRSQNSDKLAHFFNNQIINIETQDQSPISYLQNKNILARCNRQPLNTNLEFRFTPEEWEKLRKSLEQEYPDSFIEKIANDGKRNLLITLRLLELSKTCKHVIVFNARITQSKLLCGLMIAFGKSAAHIDGNTPMEYRADVINKFKSGKIQFVFNFGVFTAGFDAPNIDAVVITRPTTSVVLYGQMIGRGMRGPELGGTEEFQLVDVVDNIMTEYGGLDDVYEYFSAYWDDETR